MAAPKRAVFSLTVDSNTEHIYERTEDHTKEGKGKVKVREYKEPLIGNTSLHILTKPFEKEVQRSVERTIDGRTVRDTTYSYSDSTSSVSSGQKQHRKKSVEEKYDTSDL